MSQLVFQEDITIFENNNFLASLHRSLAQHSPAARGKDVFWECVPCPLPGFYDSLVKTVERANMENSLVHDSLMDRMRVKTKWRHDLLKVL